MKKFVIAFLAFFGLVTAVAAQQVTVPPPPEPQNILNIELSNGGVVRILLRPDKAPNHVERVKLLARSGFYDGLKFHRVIDGFMAQTGDPKGDGSGGSPLPDLKAEFNDLPHLRGAVSAARTDQPDTANSQFFICFQPALRIDRLYTVFGRVMAGMQFVDAIERGEPPQNPTVMSKVWIEADGRDALRVALPAVAAPAPQAAAVPTAEPTPAPAQ